MHKIGITSISLVATFIIGTHFFAGKHQFEVFALFLALTACVYGGAALTPSGRKFGFIELPFVVITFFASILGLLVSPTWLVAGYFIHGAWDMLHHKNKVKTPILPWFPPLCAIFDGIVGIIILALWIN